MTRKLDSPKAAVWRKRLVRFETSSLSVAQFCAQEGCSKAAFYRWRRKLKPRTYAPGDCANAGKDSTQPDWFRPLTLTQTAPVLGIEFPGGARLELLGENLELVCAVVREVMRGDSQTMRGGAGC